MSLLVCLGGVLTLNAISLAIGCIIDTVCFILKGQFTLKSKYICFLLPVALFINLDCFGVSCLDLEIAAVENSDFSLI